MFNTVKIASQIKHNCNISDASHWGLYSPCGLLLRLRDLYKVEQGIPSWQEVHHKSILNWIDQREKIWEELSSLTFQNIEVNGKSFKPFDVKGINAELLQQGLLYGAGYGQHLKPTFLLAKISKKQKMGNYSIYFTGREFARDLSSSPAMLQGNTIIARHETIKFFLADKFLEMQSKQNQTALLFAFSEYGLEKTATNKIFNKNLKNRLSHIAWEELSTFIFHEIGEASQRKLLGKWWKELLIKLPHSRTELYLRGLKDIISDTCVKGMLNHIIQQRKAGSLGFYVALLGGFRKTLFPEIMPAHERFLKTRDWNLIEEARKKGYIKTRDHIKFIKKIVAKKTLSHDEIEKQLLKYFRKYNIT
jgi:hypothetical protein